jgi:hypothetical protein
LLRALCFWPDWRNTREHCGEHQRGSFILTRVSIVRGPHFQNAVASIVGMGYSERDAIAAVEKHPDDLNDAVSYLLNTGATAVRV